MDRQDQLRIRSNGVIHQVNIPKDKLEQLNKILSRPITIALRRHLIVETADGVCCICRDNIPSIEIRYSHIDEYRGETRKASLIERYCDSCIKKVYSREPVF